MQQEESKSTTIVTRFLLVTEELFKVSLVTYLVLYLIEQLQDGFVSYFFNMNVLLIAAIVSGAITFLFSRKEGQLQNTIQLERKNIFFLVVVALISAVVIFMIIKPVGVLAYVVSPLAGIIVLLLILSFYSEKITNKL